jgi:WD40 repeat protein/serine/threonine protein kinase
MANPNGGDRTATDSGSTLSPPVDRAAVQIPIQQLLDDQRQSWRRGQRSQVEDYLKWMPHLASNPEAIVNLLVGEFRLRQELGEPLPLTDLEKRFPDLAAQLRQQLIAAGFAVPAADLASDGRLSTGPDATVVSDTTTEGTTHVDESVDSSLTIEDRDAQHGSLSQSQSTSLIEASDALAREFAERKAAGRADTPDRSTIVHLLKEALKGSPQSRSKRPVPTPLRTVPGYDILTELGRGSVGVVYKARQVGLNRIVALKMILAGGHASRTTLARFRAEAEAVASLQHGNIVQIHEVGECDGLPYFSLEYCAGGSLADRLDGTPLAPEVAAKTVVKLARAMHYAHGCKVVHRDLKPGNVLLHPKDESGRPTEREAANVTFDLESVILKVTDFGLAKRLDEESQTKTGAILGTPSYMAPEQASGNIHDVGPSADIYALGAVLYELLTGRPPFRAATPLDTVVQVINNEPVAPRRLHSGVPADLETIALKCLQKDQRKRYETAADLADDLQRFLDGEPIVARPMGIAERTWRWCRRNPLVASLSALAATFLVAGAGVSLYFAQQATERANQAELNEQRAKAERESARRSQYVAEMNLIQRAWRDVEMARVRTLLQAQVPASASDSDFRGPEWHYWNRLAHSELAVIPADVGESPCLALSRDGMTLAAGGSNRTIIVWHVADWRELARFPGHTDAIVGLNFLDDGRLVSASTSREIGDRGPFVRGAEFRIWSIADKKQLETHIISGEAEIEKSEVSQNGTRIAVADRAGTVTVANIADGSVIRSFNCAGAAVLSVAFSPEGQRLAAGFANGDAIVWNLETGATLKTYRRPRSVAHCVAFSPEGRRLAIGGSDVEENDAGFRRHGAVRIVSLDTDRLLSEIRGHTGPVLHLQFSRDGQRLVSGGNDRTIRISDAVTGRPLAIHQGHERAATAAILARDGRFAISAGDDRVIRVWDGSPNFDAWPLKSDTPAPASLTISPDGRLAALSDVGEPSVAILELPSQQQIGGWPLHGNRLPTLAWHPMRNLIAAIHSDESGHHVSLSSVDGTRQLATAIPVANANDLRFSPDGQRIAVLGSDRVLIISTKNGEQVAPISSGNGSIADAAFVSANSVRIVSIEDGRLLIRDSNSNSKPRFVENGPSPIVNAAISRDGAVIATASADRTIQLWNAIDGRDLLGQKLTGHVDMIAALTFSPDGRRLASAGMGYDHTTRIWDTTSGQELLVLTSNDGNRPRLSFSPNGDWLATCRDRVEFWDFRPIDATTAAENDALSLAQHYFELPLAREQALADLNSDRSVAENVRDMAREQLSRWKENPNHYERSAWQVIRSPYCSVDASRKALDWTNQAAVAERPHGRILKGAALYRDGKFDEARQVLTIGGQKAPSADWELVRRTFLALTELRLGHTTESKALSRELERQPNEDGAEFLLAELREQIGRVTSANH